MRIKFGILYHVWFIFSYLNLLLYLMILISILIREIKSKKVMRIPYWKPWQKYNRKVHRVHKMLNKLWHPTQSLQLIPALVTNKSYQQNCSPSYNCLSTDKVVSSCDLHIHCTNVVRLPHACWDLTIIFDININPLA